MISYEVRIVPPTSEEKLIKMQQRVSAHRHGDNTYAYCLDFDRQVLMVRAKDLETLKRHFQEAGVILDGVHNTVRVASKAGEMIIGPVPVFLPATEPAPDA